MKLVTRIWALAAVLSGAPFGFDYAQTMELRVANATVPPGGTLELQLGPTQPKPIVKGRQRFILAPPAGGGSAILGAPQGGALFSPGGDASGFAVLRGNNVQVSFNSAQALFGTLLDGPSLVLLFPVKSTAGAGQTMDLALDPTFSDWVDPATGQDYNVKLTSGVLTIGGSLSVASLSPGGGQVPAGRKIVISGTGFQASTKLRFTVDARIASQTLVSSAEIDVTLDKTVNLTGAGVIVNNPQPKGETVTFYTFQKTKPLAPSTHKLLAMALPLFSKSTYTTAYFHPVLAGSTFSGIAMANAGGATAQVDLQLSDASGFLGAVSISLPPNKRIVRDISELFPGVAIPASGSTLQANTVAPLVKLLGLLGDDAAHTITPVDPSPTP